MCIGGAVMGGWLSFYICRLGLVCFCYEGVWGFVYFAFPVYDFVYEQLGFVVGAVCG